PCRERLLSRFAQEPQSHTLQRTFLGTVQLLCQPMDAKSICCQTRMRNLSKIAPDLRTIGSPGIYHRLITLYSLHVPVLSENRLSRLHSRCQTFCHTRHRLRGCLPCTVVEVEVHLAVKAHSHDQIRPGHRGTGGMMPTR